VSSLSLLLSSSEDEVKFLWFTVLPAAIATNLAVTSKASLTVALDAK